VFRFPAQRWFGGGITTKPHNNQKFFGSFFQKRTAFLPF
jgi:hypothetical protein